jgi:hypothetical protein
VHDHQPRIADIQVNDLVAIRGDALSSADGPVDRGRAWLGHASDAASYFNAIERYEDRRQLFRLSLRHPEDLGLKAAITRSVVLTRLIGLFHWAGDRSGIRHSISNALGTRLCFTSAPCG